MIPQLEIRSNVTNSLIAPVEGRDGNAFSENSASAASAIPPSFMKNSAPTSSRRSERPTMNLVTQSKTLEEKVFDSLVGLKVATSHFVSYLASDEKDKIFDEIEYFLTPEEWTDDDQLPSLDSFKNFLRYVVRNSDNSWDSLGVGDNGEFLAAWVRDDLRMTASFDDKKVAWTVRKSDADGVSFANGVSEVPYFADQARFYLGL
jgi:hypothetical protein